MPGSVDRSIDLSYPALIRSIHHPVPSTQIKHLKTKEYKNVHKRERTVSRAYGGSRCANCVRDR